MFQNLLLKVKKKYQFLIHHYCLMNTHFHMALSIANLHRFSLGLQWVKQEYTKYFNKKSLRTGPLWRERFKSLVIENESYLYACGLYIEYNPVTAGMVKKSEEWPYSSNAYYLTGKQNPLVDVYDKTPKLPVDVDIQNAANFTQGYAVGSELFKLQIRERLFDEQSVPA